MKTGKRVVPALLALALMVSARAQTPQFINYQGRLTQGTNLVNGGLHMSFRLYTLPTGGTLVYEDEALAPVIVVDGLYSTAIGDDTTTGSLTEALSQPEIWIETVVNGTPLAPRERIASVAYAAHAWSLSGNAGTVTGVTFLGTTDDKPVELRVNGQRAAILLTDTNGWGYAPRFIVGPSVNDIGTNSPGATIAGGGVTNSPNRIESGANFAFIGAGLGNTVRAGGKSGFIGAGYYNTIEGAVDCVLGGGFLNAIQTNCAASVLAGGTGNSIGPGATNAVLTGGALNRIQTNAVQATISGGWGNNIGPAANHGTIGGGYENSIQTGATDTVVAGGLWNSIGPSSVFATVGGGARNSASGLSATVSGGYNNRAVAGDSAIGGGVDNLALGFRSVIPGGFANETTGAYSFAAGRRAKARHDGSFVWADAADADFGSSASNQFLIRATGGLGVGVTNPAYVADFGGRIRLRQDALGSAPGLWLHQPAPAGDRAFVGMSGEGYVGLYGNAGAGWGLMMNVTNGNVGIGTVPNGTNKLTVAGGAYCSGTTWVNASDRNLKDGFAPVNAAEVLAKVSALPISTWHYRSEGAATRHLGPMAQDFRAAFGLGYDDTSIATVDEGGVALAAIQALHAEVGALKKENAALQQQLDAVLQRLRALEVR